MSELANALSPLFVKENDELRNAKRLLSNIIDLVFYVWNNGSRTEEEREDKMNNLMAYYNNFEELMSAKGMTILEYLKWACNEIGYYGPLVDAL